MPSERLLRTECQTCGAWAEFAGRTSVIDGRTCAIAYCAQCRVDIPFWTSEVETLLKDFDHARFLRAIAERLCRVATGSEREIRAALALPTSPAPLGARECLITAGVLSRASVELQFSEPPLARADLERTLGSGQALPRTGPGASHNLAYPVRVAGAPACVVVFAAFRELPAPESRPKNILLRIDPA
jgi:hypothetical protein